MLDLIDGGLADLDAGDFVSSEAVSWLSETPIRNDALLANVRANMARDLPRIHRAAAHDETFAFVGGGPSLARCLDGLKRRQAGDAAFKVWTSGLTAKYLQDNGVKPWGYLNVDPKPHMAEYIATADPGCRFFLASCSDPAVFEVVKGRRVWMAHVPQGQEDIALALSEPGTPFIAGGSTTPLRWTILAYVLGCRDFDLFGLDSSFEIEDGAYAYEKRSMEPLFPVETEDGRRFLTTRILAGQADAFCRLVREMMTLDPRVNFTFHGDGLLPHLIRLMSEAHPQGDHDMATMKTEVPQDSSSYGKTRPMPASVEAKDQPMSSLTKGKGPTANRPGMMD